MKKGIFSLSFLLFFAVACFGQKQKFKIFGVKITANEIVGNNSFNDLGLLYHTTVINNFTDDSATYLWRLGSVRINAKQFKYGTFPLFNLSYANNKQGYLLLDSIDFSYYNEYGFSIVEAHDSIIKNDNKYIEFKEYIKNDMHSLLEKRIFLWQHKNDKFRQKLFDSKYFKNVQNIHFKDSTLKKLRNAVGLKVGTNLNEMLSLISISKKNNNDTLSSADSLAVKMYFSRVITNVIKLEGTYVSTRFRDEYINKIDCIIRRINTFDPVLAEDNEFNENLMAYLNDTTEDCLSNNYAINSSISGFKFTGAQKITKVVQDSLISDLSAFLNLDKLAASKISTVVKTSLSKDIDRVLTNEFSKVWLFMFGTDYKIDTLKFKNAMDCGCNRKNHNQYSNFRSKQRQEQQK